jgi:hypothetical protein
VRRARLGLAGALALAACEERARPWEGAGAGGAPPAPAIVPTVLSDARDAAAEEPPPAPARVGGPWVRCYGGFHVSGEPLRDVTRLAMLCGPSNGMRRLSTEATLGEVSEGGAPARWSFQAQRGACYRVFAVAEPTVADLDVVVVTSRGMPVAADHGEDAWPVVQPDRAFCALDDDRLDVLVSARRGRGRFAAEVWVLPPP